MIFLRIGWALLLAIAFVLAAPAADSAMTREQARKAIEHVASAKRLAGVLRLGEIGTMADADRLVARLADDEQPVREAAGDAMWQIWGRSGDAAIDKLFNRGVAQMRDSKLDEALATFSEIIRRKPAFAEGWNKRATILFLLGQYERSLADCDEVLKRNPNHFGALSGAAQIHLELGNPDSAQDYFERALKVNPGLAGVERAIELIEQRRQDKQRRSI
jgi:tetratricopeptide (TPR) repeat protein